MGGSGGGTSAPPARLAFTTAPQTINSLTCSQALTLETQNALGQTTPVTTSTAVNFSVVPGGIGFFRDASCMVMAGAPTIPTGSSSLTVYFGGVQGGTYQLTASAPSLTPASQQAIIRGPPTSLVFVSAPPVAPVAAGLCFEATVEARNSTGAVAVSSPAVISLTSMLTNGLRFFSNSTCSTATTSVNMAAGQSRAAFYVKTISGGANSIVASATFGSATQPFAVVPVVRRGQCTMGSLALQGTCTIPPPAPLSLARTMLIIQATTSSDEPGPSEIRCQLSAPDTITCDREVANATATISWQTAELATGLNVRRFAASGCLVPSVPMNPPVNPASTFVLSSFSGFGNQFDGDDISAVRLAPDGSSVLIENRSGAPCEGVELQVVELSGVTTLRGGAPGLTFGQRQTSVTGLVAASPNTTVLFNQALLSAAFPTTLPMCNLFVRSEMPTPTSLLFSRGSNNPQPTECAEVVFNELPWERVDFGARARVVPVTLTLNQNQMDLTIAQVDPTRTLVFAGGQMVGGQASGETSNDNNGNDGLGQATARFDLVSETLLRVTRGRSQANATITFYLVELEP